MTTSIENTPGQAHRPADGSNCPPRPDEEPEGKGPMPADLLQNNHGSRRKGNIKPQDVIYGITSIAPHPTDIASKSENEDTQMDESDTSSTSLAREGRQEDIRHSPKRNKKMKIEKTVEHHPERSRSLPRRVNYKIGKP
jgi:hypothetical protein